MVKVYTQCLPPPLLTNSFYYQSYRPFLVAIIYKYIYFCVSSCAVVAARRRRQPIDIHKSRGASVIQYSAFTTSSRARKHFTDNANELRDAMQCIFCADAAAGIFLHTYMYVASEYVAKHKSQHEQQHEHCRVPNHTPIIITHIYIYTHKHTYTISQSRWNASHV